MFPPVRTSPDLVFSQAIEKAMRRCRTELPVGDLRAGEIAMQVERLAGVSGVWSDWRDWPDRAAGLYIELVTIGTYARNYNNEPPLDPSELTAFAEQIKKFLNSWFHE